MKNNKKYKISKESKTKTVIKVVKKSTNNNKMKIDKNKNISLNDFKIRKN